MEYYDFSGIPNPKVVVEKRVKKAEAASTAAPSPAAPPASGPQFFKPFTPEQKAAQNAQLARLLAQRNLPVQEPSK